MNIDRFSRISFTDRHMEMHLSVLSVTARRSLHLFHLHHLCTDKFLGNVLDDCVFLHNNNWCKLMELLQ